MIPALEMLSVHHPMMERNLSMGTPVFKSIDSSAYGSDQDDGIAGKGHSKHLSLFQIF
jgi:hypothetical protein